MAKKVSVNHLVERVWDIDGYPNYFFGHDKRLYRFNPRGQVRINKRIIIGTTQGYILKSKFFSLEQLRAKILRHKPQEQLPTDHPMDF